VVRDGGGARSVCSEVMHPHLLVVPACLLTARVVVAAALVCVVLRGQPRVSGSGASAPRVPLR
jgi:hypothetical protein